MKPKTFISAVVYARNEQNRLAKFVTDLDQLLHQLFSVYEIILVDDASTDGTRDSAFAIKDRVQGHVTLIRLAGSHGVDTALASGTDLAIGDLIYEIEDLSAPLAKELFAALYEQAAIQGCSVAFARPGNILRLASRKGLYAMEDRNLPGGRALAYRNCGLPWGEVRHPSLRRLWRRELAQLLAALPVNREFPWLLAFALLATAWVFWLWPGMLTLRRAITGILLVFFTTGLALGLLARCQKGPREKYKVRDIHRINRY